MNLNSKVDQLKKELNRKVKQSVTININVGAWCEDCQNEVMESSKKVNDDGSITIMVGENVE